MPYYQDNHIQIFNKDCRVMDELEDESVQCVVTSPPYWGLRKYAGLPDLVWGDNHCEHQWNGGEVEGEGYSGKTRWQHTGGRSEMPTDGFEYVRGYTGFCSLCGAWKGSYGLEPTPEMYIEHTIEILREIRRVLRKDGMVFWNIGDSYAGNVSRASNGGRAGFGTPREGVFTRGSDTLKPKDLCLIPFRVAIAAQEDGWWVRSVIIWSKPNPMPESVTDRPTESHEYILMLTKSARYYWDADAVREAHQDIHGLDRFTGKGGVSRPEYKPHTQGWGEGGMIHKDRDYNPAGRNIRSVWEFPTQPYPEAHFAVFPEKLPEICIKAATPEVGCCSKCGAPWEQVTEGVGKQRVSWGVDRKARVLGTPGEPAYKNIIETLGWRPTCKCKTIKPPVPSLVLDPFAGAGTTLWVAKTLGRKAVGYELSEEYCRLSVERNRQQILELK